jgi:type I restriction enzyme S subunit
MSFPRYPKYKESGVEWLGEVPEHWGVALGRRFFAQKREPALDGDEQLSATQKYGVVPQRLFMEMEDQKVVLALSGTGNFKHVQKDDFVISLRSFQGGIERSLFDGCVSPAYTVLRPVEEIHAGYFGYVLKSAQYIEALQTLTDGIRDGKTISYQQFGGAGLPSPPIAEQHAIASFLDRETAKIDALIAEQQRLIELLQEKRQAVISHAVTKGLNPDAPMKDSGIEWLGEVPAHWEVMRLKHAKANVKNAFVDGPFGSNLKSEHFIENGDVYVIESGFATQGHLDPAELKTISLDHFHTIDRSEARADDIIIAKIGAQFGKSSILPNLDKPAVVSGNSLKLTVNREICDINFMHWHLVNLKVLGVIDDIVAGSAQPALSLGGMNNLPMLLPPRSEQEAIVQFVKNKVEEFDTLAAEAQRATTLLQERRSALISAAVTGQIDVRELAPKEAA